MGMYDVINVEIPCPKCGATVSVFQSKDANCDLSIIDPTYVNNFYGDCEECGCWVEYIRDPATKPAKSDKPFNLDEVLDLGFELRLEKVELE